MRDEVAPQFRARLFSWFQLNDGMDGLSGNRVRQPNDRRLHDGRMQIERALYFERTDQMLYGDRKSVV